MSFSPVFLSFLYSTATGAGLHWFVLHRRHSAEETFELFDSLGVTSEFVKKTVKYQEKSSDHTVVCVFNETRLQETNSTSCGEFCVFFIIQRMFNEDLDFETFINEVFSKNPSKNEEAVQVF